MYRLEKLYDSDYATKVSRASRMRRLARKVGEVKKATSGYRPTVGGIAKAAATVKKGVAAARMAKLPWWARGGVKLGLLHAPRESDIQGMGRMWESDKDRRQRRKWITRGAIAGGLVGAASRPAAMVTDAYKLGRRVGLTRSQTLKSLSEEIRTSPSAQFRLRNLGLGGAIIGMGLGAMTGYHTHRLRKWYKNRQERKRQVESLRVVGNLREMSPQRAAWAAETAMKAYKNPHIPALRKGLRKNRYPSTLYSMANKFARYARKKETMMDTLYNPVKLPSFVGSAYRSGA